MAKANEAPAAGNIKSVADSADTTKVVTNAKEVRAGEGLSLGVGPGSFEHKPSDGLVLEGLGSLTEEELHLEEDLDPNAGSGDYVVVLHDTVAGAGKTFSKGKVRRLSNFIPNFDDPAKVSQSRAIAKRLFDLKAIRLATSEEQGQDVVDLTNESEALIQERNKRIALEQKLEQQRMAQIEENRGPQVGNAPQTPESNWQ